MPAGGGASVSAFHAADRGTAGAGAAAGREARALRFLPDPPRDPPASTRRRSRGARTAEPRAAGARTRLFGRLGDLLLDRPVAHRPDREQSLPRPVPERRNGVRPRRLPGLA